MCEQSWQGESELLKSNEIRVQQQMKLREAK